MFKLVLKGKEGRDKVKIGVDTIGDAIRQTLGFAGRNVMLGNGYASAHISKDGYTIARMISLSDPTENMGCNLLKEVASKTVAEAGDATTQSMILAQFIINAGMEAINDGANPVQLKKGIEKAVECVVKELKRHSRSIDSHETLVQIATISANNDPEIGKLIADAFKEIGADGKIDVSDSKTHETYVDIVAGSKIDRGYTHPVFINHPKKRVCEMENPYILVSDIKLQTMPQILPFFEKVLNAKSGRPLLLIVDQLDGEAASLIYRNRAEGKLNVAVILAPDYGANREASLEDIAIMTGATFISDKKGMTIKAADVKDCGGAERVLIEEKFTTFINGDGNADDVENRCNLIRQEIEEASTPEYKAHQESRLAKLIGKMGSIKVGAITQTEAAEKKDRIDDALCATRAAKEEGYMVGGGGSYLACVGELVMLYNHTLPTSLGEARGIDIVMEALKAPFKQIMLNGGFEGEEADKYYNKFFEPGHQYGYGFNLKTERWEDLFDAGVIDPTKCSRCALENAASIAAIFLTTECVVADPKPKEY